MCLAGMVEKFEFGRTQLRDPHFGAQHFVKFYLSFIFISFKISCVQLERLKSLNFRGPVLGEPSSRHSQFLLGLVYF